jgi:hypothetical protein
MPLTYIHYTTPRTHTHTHTHTYLKHALRPAQRKYLVSVCFEPRTCHYTPCVPVLFVVCCSLQIVEPAPVQAGLQLCVCMCVCMNVCMCVHVFDILCMIHTTLNYIYIIPHYTNTRPTSSSGETDTHSTTEYGISSKPSLGISACALCIHTARRGRVSVRARVTTCAGYSLHGCVSGANTYLHATHHTHYPPHHTHVPPAYSALEDLPPTHPEHPQSRRTRRWRHATRAGVVQCPIVRRPGTPRYVHVCMCMYV